MTTNQIAYWDLKERERANREAEAQKSQNIAVERAKAEAAQLQANAAWHKAVSQHQKDMTEMNEIEPAWSKIFGSIARGIGAVIPF